MESVDADFQPVFAVNCPRTGPFEVNCVDAYVLDLTSDGYVAYF
jgi:hypothetical protein